jgi:hypothetical protein
MKKMFKATAVLTLALAGITAAQAQVTYNGDLLVGFTIAANNDLVYDLGPESSLTNGYSWNLTAALTAAGLNTSLSSAQWGVVGAKTVSGAKTIWLTSLAVPDSINNGQYATISPDVATLVNNDFTAVGAGNYATPAYGLSYSWYYETDQGANASSVFTSDYTDPNQGGPGSIAFYSSTATGVVTNLGTFTLTSGGTLTFNVVASTPPPPKIVSVTRAGATSTIYFTTTNGFTYTLYYTNSAGLTTSVSNWPSLATTVSGNGLTNSLSDTTTDANRFYRIGVH